MNIHNQNTVLKSLSRSMLDRGSEAALEAVLKNLRIVGQALPQPDTYERARLAVVEAMLTRDDEGASHRLRFHYRLLDFASEACLHVSRLNHQERDALRFIELVICDNFYD